MLGLMAARAQRRPAVIALGRKQLSRETNAAIRRVCRDDIHQRIAQTNRSSIWRCLKPVIDGGKPNVITVPGVHPDLRNGYFVSVGPNTFC